MGFKYCTNVIVDHCSVTWSVDECLSAYANKNLTVQNCIIAESLNESIHYKGAHGYGGIWGGINASFHHNLISTHNSRNPRIGTDYTVHTYNNTPDYESLIDIRNNVFYNWGMNSGYGGENNTRVNFVNNYYKPTSYSKVKRIYQHYPGEANAGTTLYLSGNVMENNPGITADNWLGVDVYSDDTIWTKCDDITDGYTDSSGKLWTMDQYIYDYPVTTTTAEQAYEDVLNDVGSNIYLDSIDQRIINNVKNNSVPVGSKSGTGFIDTPWDVGGWVSLYGDKKIDSDNDGIPDDWEIENGLDPSNADGSDISANGYTNIENYANYLAGTKYDGYGIDTSELSVEINRAADLDESLYNADDWTHLEGIISKAKGLLYSSSANQYEVYKAAEELKQALDELKPDYTEQLKAEIEKAKSYDLNDYTLNSANKLKNAIEEAESILEQGNKDLYLDTIKSLKTAVNTLVTNGKGVLKTVIDAYKNMDLSHLVEEDTEIIYSTLERAEEVYNDPNASEKNTVPISKELSSLLANDYRRKENGKEIETQDFESGTADKAGYIKCNDQYNYDVEDKDDSKILSITNKDPQTYSEAMYLKECDLQKYNHFIISYNIYGRYQREIVLCDKDRKKIYYLSSGYFYTGDGTIHNLDKGISNLFTMGFQDGDDSKNLVSLEVNRYTNEVIYYFNNLPIGKVELGDTELYYYGFSVSLRSSTAYFDNLKLIDLDYENNCISGDADYDAHITANDAAMLLSRILKENNLTELEKVGIKNAFELLDMDCDGILTSADVTHILQKALDSSYIPPVDTTTTETTTLLTTTEATTESTTEATTKRVKNILYSLDFENANAGLDSPYTKDVFTIENSSDRIDVFDVDIFDYKKAIKIDGNTITIDAPSGLYYDLILRTTGDSPGFIYVGENTLIILPNEDKTYHDTIRTNGYDKELTFTGSGLYIAALVVYEYVQPTTESTTLITESTTETTTESTTESTTECTTYEEIDFDFYGLDNGDYTTDFTNGIFSLIAGNGSYKIDGTDKKYITLYSPDYSPEK